MGTINAYLCTLLLVLSYCKDLSATSNTNPSLPQPADTSSANRTYTTAKKFAYNASYDSSNYYLEEAARLYEELGYYDRQIDCFYLKGLNFKEKGPYEHGIEFLKNALGIASAKLPENHLLSSRILNLIGDLYTKLGESDQALKYHEESLGINLELFGNGHSELIANYIGIGSVYDDKGQYDVARDYFERALKIGSETVGEKDKRMALAYLNLSVTFARQNDIDQALIFANKSLRISEQVLAKKDAMRAGIYNNIGVYYYIKGDLEKAVETLKQSLSISMTILGESHEDIARAYFNIANIQEKRQEYEEAITSHLKALEIRLSRFGDRHPDTGSSYLNLGIAYDRLKRYDEALENYEQALSIQLTLLGPIHPKVNLSYNNIGVVYDSKGKHRLALSYFQRAITALTPGFVDTSIYQNPMLQNILNRDYLLNTLKNKASVFHNLYKNESLAPVDLEMSMATFELASQLLHQMRRQVEGSDSRLALSEENYKIHSRAIAAAWTGYRNTNNQRYKLMALNFVRRGKAAVFQQLLSQIEAQSFSRINPALLQKERDLRGKLAAIEVEILDLYQERATLKTQQIHLLEEEQFKLNSALMRLLEKIEQGTPGYYEAKYPRSEVTVQSIQRQLDSDMAILDYFVADSAIYTFVLTADSVHFIQVKVDSGLVNRRARSLVKNIKLIERDEFIQNSQALFEILIGPVQKEISAKHKLFVVPDGTLHYVPFEVLLTEKTHQTASADFTLLPYLIKQCRISYAYNIEHIFSSRESSMHEGPTSFIGFAPVFSDSVGNGNMQDNLRSLMQQSMAQNIEHLILTNEGRQFSELRYSEFEVRFIKRLFDKNNLEAVAYFHDAASEDKFKEEAKDYSIVHIATHSLLNEKEPKLSAIIFSQPQKEEDDVDGVLYAAEAYSLILNANLLVLSSCEGAMGQLKNGEGIMALTRPFLYAGANQMIVALWKVTDRHTFNFFKLFYTYVLDGMQFSDALRQAKIEILRTKATSWPKFWSSFVLIGNGSEGKKITGKR